MRTLPPVFLLALLGLSGSACASHHTGDSTPAPRSQVEIENRSSVDMDLYLRGSRGQAIRLGFAPAGETTTFPLTPALLAGAAAIRFEARPVRGQGRTVVSEPFLPGPGAELRWSIPPQ